MAYRQQEESLLEIGADLVLEAAPASSLVPAVLPLRRELRPAAPARAAVLPQGIAVAEGQFEEQERARQGKNFRLMMEASQMNGPTLSYLARVLSGKHCDKDVARHFRKCLKTSSRAGKVFAIPVTGEDGVAYPQWFVPADLLSLLGEMVGTDAFSERPFSALGRTLDEETLPRAGEMIQRVIIDALRQSQRLKRQDFSAFRTISPYEVEMLIESLKMITADNEDDVARFMKKIEQRVNVLTPQRGEVVVRQGNESQGEESSKTVLLVNHRGEAVVEQNREVKESPLVYPLEHKSDIFGSTEKASSVDFEAVLKLFHPEAVSLLLMSNYLPADLEEAVFQARKEREKGKKDEKDRGNDERERRFVARKESEILTDAFDLAKLVVFDETQRAEVRRSDLVMSLGALIESLEVHQAIDGENERLSEYLKLAVSVLGELGFEKGQYFKDVNLKLNRAAMAAIENGLAPSIKLGRSKRLSEIGRNMITYLACPGTLVLPPGVPEEMEDQVPVSSHIAVGASRYLSLEALLMLALERFQGRVAAFDQIQGRPMTEEGVVAFRGVMEEIFSIVGTRSHEEGALDPVEIGKAFLESVRRREEGVEVAVTDEGEQMLRQMFSTAEIDKPIERFANLGENENRFIFLLGEALLRAVRMGYFHRLRDDAADGLRAFAQAYFSVQMGNITEVNPGYYSSWLALTNILPEAGALVRQAKGDGATALAMAPEKRYANLYLDYATPEKRNAFSFKKFFGEAQARLGKRNLKELEDYCNFIYRIVSGGAKYGKLACVSGKSAAGKSYMVDTLMGLAQEMSSEAPEGKKVGVLPLSAYFLSPAAYKGVEANAAIAQLAVDTVMKIYPGIGWQEAVERLNDPDSDLVLFANVDEGLNRAVEGARVGKGEDNGGGRQLAEEVQQLLLGMTAPNAVPFSAEIEVPVPGGHRQKISVSISPQHFSLTLTGSLKYLAQTWEKAAKKQGAGSKVATNKKEIEESELEVLYNDPLWWEKLLKKGYISADFNTRTGLKIMLKSPTVGDLVAAWPRPEGPREDFERDLIKNYIGGQLGERVDMVIWDPAIHEAVEFVAKRNASKQGFRTLERIREAVFGEITARGVLERDDVEGLTDEQIEEEQRKHLQIGVMRMPSGRMAKIASIPAAIIQNAAQKAALPDLTKPARSVII